MSVLEFDEIDGMGKSNDGERLILMISDHLDWKEESQHLLTLQEKINSYLSFIDTKQFLDYFPGSHFEEFVIEIHFMYGKTKTCDEFLVAVGNQLSQYNIVITTETGVEN